MASAEVKIHEWLQPDNLMLIESWMRDNYTLTDVANRIGINLNTLRVWRANYEEIDKAISSGAEIADYKVENALFKSATGYRTKEVKTITEVRGGVMISRIVEKTDKEVAPNVSAIQCWLYNRLPQKWKKNRDNAFDFLEEDQQITVEVRRAGKDETTNQPVNPDKSEEDLEWTEEVNNSITITKNNEPKKKKTNNRTLGEQIYSSKECVSKTTVEDDLDEWPDNWEELINED